MSRRTGFPNKVDGGCIFDDQWGGQYFLNTIFYKTKNRAEHKVLCIQGENPND